jgi:hypothetical protein
MFSSSEFNSNLSFNNFITLSSFGEIDEIVLINLTLNISVLSALFKSFIISSTIIFSSKYPNAVKYWLFSELVQFLYLLINSSAMSVLFTKYFALSDKI